MSGAGGRGPGADSDRAALAWLIAVVFMGTTALFAWQYARARGETASLRNDYVQLQERLQTQESRNKELLSGVEEMQRQLDGALKSIEALRAQINGVPPATDDAPPPPE